ncbi:MAG: glycosyltransferase family 2 protein [Symploca sp. SIO3C6]|uniref:Glycosyltransferase family 2 protein n=1 Tax=Symploca sp. SIO1C4 TaxID=2607765 RepID=A0A6B3N6K3_9CYAN|nr:glycosyltransferase family 2 protein [Symploca sp. SIO3C6]NER26252.1 glycosyltransferase family 2 protein [Symploca sp. SIO1C4]NET04457.1 glycosyltransferase family 2 protein [Symploca sp. SIO2B6]
MKSEPLVSFGLPVYNAREEYLRQLLNSLLTQDLQEFEIVISDNASDNGTSEICQEYAGCDSRVRYHRNQENIGQINNFNKVLELSCGKYFRWIGADDWLESDYARRCVEVLEANEQFIGVSTYQDFTHEDGYIHYREYEGERLDSPMLHKRIWRLLWFWKTGEYGVIDTIYTIMRREVLLQTRKLQFLPSMDQVLAFKLVSLGRFTHIPACLAHRRWQPFHKISKEDLYQRYGGEHYKKLFDPLGLRRSAICWSIIREGSFSNCQKSLCLLAILSLTMTTLRKKIYSNFRSTASRVRRSIFKKNINSGLQTN